MKNNYNEEVMNHLEKCGVVTCIHCNGGFCHLCRKCDLYEQTLLQEN